MHFIAKPLFDRSLINLSVSCHCKVVPTFDELIGYDYRGCGRSTGKPKLSHMKADISAAWEKLIELGECLLLHHERHFVEMNPRLCF